jgi:hypothetical protein
LVSVYRQARFITTPSITTPAVEARTLYEEAATYCHSAKDHVTRDLFEQLLKEPANAGIVRSGTSKRANTAFFMAFSSGGTLVVPMLGRMRAWYS